MTSLHQLLAATDLSSSSLHAVDRGFLIASRSGAKYAVIHALGLDALAPLREFLGGDAEVVSMKVTDEVRHALAPLLADPSRNLGVTATLELPPGVAARAVPEHAEAIGADLILVGAHGKGFLQRFLIGSTVSRLLRTSKQPVLVVKEPCRVPYRRVLVAVDFSPASVRAMAIAGAVGAGADLVLLNVFDVPFQGQLRLAGVSDEVIDRYRVEARDRALRQLHGLARAAGVPVAGYQVVVRQGDAARIILTEEERCDCDLIVMGKHGAHVAEELLLGSVTKHVLAESRSDLLVVVDRRAPIDPSAPTQAC